MSSEHDKLLAEGPRVAPEPPIVDDTGRGRMTVPTQPVTQEPAPSPAAAAPPAGSPARPRSRSGSGIGRRLLPLLVVAGLAARAFGSGRAGAAVFALVAVVAITLVVVRKARQS